MRRVSWDANVPSFGTWLWLSKPMGSHSGVGAPPIFRAYFSGDWDVHWGYGLLTHGPLIVDAKMAGSLANLIRGPLCHLNQTQHKQLHGRQPVLGWCGHFGWERACFLFASQIRPVVATREGGSPLPGRRGEPEGAGDPNREVCGFDADGLFDPLMDASLHWI